MLYHYTSTQALEGILRGCPSEKGLCFWASRYDCFGDKEEYKIGIETIKTLLPKVENRLLPNRQVASSFIWDDIKGNKTLPMPYVISLTKRNNNEYMWENYADKGHGVVLALNIEEMGRMPFTDIPHMIMQKPCLYKDFISEEELYKEIENEYFFCASTMLNGPKKEFAFGLLKDYPQLFVKLIAMYLLGYVAPRIKSCEYNTEEEIRIIIPSQRPHPEVMSFLNQLRGTKILDINVEDMEQMVENEKQRERSNGESIYYRELFLPSNILSKVYIKDASILPNIKTILVNKGFDDREIEILK